MAFLLGLACGYFLTLLITISIEKDCVREGIAKLYGKYYRLIPLNDDGGENDGKL